MRYTPMNSTRILIVGFTALSLLLLSSCILDREGKGPPACQGEAAGILFKLTVPGPSSQANQGYETAVTWQAEMLTPDSQNTCGNDKAINVTKTYSGNRNSSGDYTIEQAASGERPGLWRFTITSMNASSTCEKTLTPGDTKLIAFTHQQSGCQ